MKNVKYRQSSIKYIIKYISYLQISSNTIRHIIQYIIIYIIKYIKHTKYMRFISTYVFSNTYRLYSVESGCLKIRVVLKDLTDYELKNKTIKTLILSTTIRRVSYVFAPDLVIVISMVLTPVFVFLDDFVFKRLRENKSYLQKSYLQKSYFSTITELFNKPIFLLH